MTKSQIKQHLNYVHTKHTQWEAEGDAYYYTHDLWEAAADGINARAMRSRWHSRFASAKANA